MHHPQFFSHKASPIIASVLNNLTQLHRRVTKAGDGLKLTKGHAPYNREQRSACSQAAITSKLLEIVNFKPLSMRGLRIALT